MPLWSSICLYNCNEHLVKWLNFVQIIMGHPVYIPNLLNITNSINVLKNIIVTQQGSIRNMV